MLARAVDSQRERLESVRAEYESRRKALAARTREVEQERDRLRDEQAQLVCASLELEKLEQTVASRVQRSAPVPEPAPAREVVAHKSIAQASIAQGPGPDDTDWWSKQVGSPLEAA